MNDLVSDWIKRRLAVPASVAGPVVEQPVQNSPTPDFENPGATIAPELSHSDETKPATPQNLDNGSPFAVPQITTSDRISGGLAALADAASRAGRSNSNYFNTVIQNQEAQRDNALRRQQLAIEAARQIALQKYEDARAQTMQDQLARQNDVLAENKRHNQTLEQIALQNSSNAAKKSENLGVGSDQKEQDRMESEYRKELLGGGRSAAGMGFKTQDAKVNSAIHARELIEGSRDPKTGEVNINQIQSPELAQSIASIVSGGNAPSLEAMKSMEPQALSADIQKRIGYIFGEPRAILPKEWVDNLIHMIDRQGTVSEDLRDTYLNQIKKIGKPSRLNPDRAKKIEDEAIGTSYKKRFGLDKLPYKIHRMPLKNQRI